MTPANFYRHLLKWLKQYNYKCPICRKELPWKYIGKKVGTEYTLFFLEIEDFSLSPKIAILNSLFMDLYNKQRNIVNFYSGETIQSASMTNADPVFSFNF